MSRLAPAAADTVLTDAEMQLCLRHYIVDKQARAWIDEGDTAPELIWDIHEDMAHLSSQLAEAAAKMDATSPLPGPNMRWRDQYLKLHLPKVDEKVVQCTTDSSVSSKAKAEQEYVLVSEHEEEEANGGGGKSASSSHPSTKLATRREQPVAGGRRGGANTKTRGTATTSPSPRRSSVNVSQTSLNSPRQSTGSSVVIVSQPTTKRVDNGACMGQGGCSTTTSKSASRGRELEAGDELGKKRQRSMEEFMYRGA